MKRPSCWAKPHAGEEAMLADLYQAPAEPSAVEAGHRASPFERGSQIATALRSRSFRWLPIRWSSIGRRPENQATSSFSIRPELASFIHMSTWFLLARACSLVEDKASEAASAGKPILMGLTCKIFEPSHARFWRSRLPSKERCGFCKRP